MLVGEILQRVQSLYSKGVQSDDSRLTPRHTYSAVTSARATLLRQMVNKNQMVSSWSYQLLPCIELEKAPISECPCIPSEGCMILRSKYELPAPITGLEKHMIKYVSDIDGNMRYDITSFENKKYSDGNKYTANKPDAYFRNRRLYVTTVKTRKAVALEGLFEDFVKAYLFPQSCPDCNTSMGCLDIMELEFPFEGSHIKTLLELANHELIIIMKQLKEDKFSNSADDDAPTGMIHQPRPQEPI